MNNYQIGYTIVIQVNETETGPTANFYERGFIVDLDTKEEQILPGDQAKLILNTIQIYHNSQNKEGEEYGNSDGQG